MRPAEYTPEEIIAAGEDILAAGRNVTGFAIRQRIGGGSPARLRQVWDEHLASKRVADAEPVAELPIEVAETVSGVSKALVERIATLAVELNDKAVKAAERRVAEVVRSAGEQREQVERELADAAQTVDDLEQAIDEVKAERDVLQEKLADKTREAQEQAVEIAQLKERLSAANQAHQEYKQEAAKEAQRSAEKVVAAEKAAEAMKTERDRAQVELTQKTKEAQENAVAVAQLTERVAAVEHTHQEYRADVAKEAQRNADKVIAAEKALADHAKDAAAAREMLARVSGELEALRAQNDKLLAAFSGKGA